jgi:hypothetical protein
MDLPPKGGTVTKRKSLEQVYETTGKMPDRLAEEPELSAAGLHIWNWFLELSSVRGSSGFGPLPISFLEMQSWSQLTGKDISPFEVRAIKTIDSVYLRLKSE